MDISIQQRPSPNFRPKNVRKVGFILHWMGGYLPGTDGEFAKQNGIATHYGVGSTDGRGKTLAVHQYVQDKDRSFGSFNDDADTRGLSIEIENDINLPYPGKPTPAVHELVARLMAAKAIEHNMCLGDEKRPRLVLGDFPDHRFYQRAIPAFGRDFNVTTHRSMALKDCPGTTDVQWIVNLSNQFITEILEGDDDVSFNDQIKHRNVDAPAAVVLADTLTGVQQAAPKLDDIIKKLDDALAVKHRDIDAPADVVQADTLTATQQTSKRLDAVELLLAKIAAKVGA
jgi:hypothetical protein